MSSILERKIFVPRTRLPHLESWCSDPSAWKDATIWEVRVFGTPLTWRFPRQARGDAVIGVRVESSSLLRRPRLQFYSHGPEIGSFVPDGKNAWIWISTAPIPCSALAFQPVELVLERECLESRCVRRLVQDRIDHSFVQVGGADAVVTIQDLNSYDWLGLVAFSLKDACILDLEPFRIRSGTAAYFPNSEIQSPMRDWASHPFEQDPSPE